MCESLHLPTGMLSADWIIQFIYSCTIAFTVVSKGYYFFSKIILFVFSSLGVTSVQPLQTQDGQECKSFTGHGLLGSGSTAPGSGYSVML